MNIIIKNAKIIDSKSPLNGETVDIEVRTGRIAEIGKNLSSKGAKLVDLPNLHVSHGWIDMHANIQDPGYEHKEDLDTAVKAAAAGGFTRIAVSPLSIPVRDSKAQIEYIKNKSKKSIVEVLPYGCVSKDAAGKELAELYDMKAAGAVGFFDGKKSIENPNLLLRAMEYCQSFNGFIINFPHNRSIAYDGMMNEGKTSTELGLKGIPELSEELIISRDLYLRDYCEGQIHFSTVSSIGGLKLIANAKKAKQKVSCDVSAAHLMLDDSLLESFDSRLKNLPPFRNIDTVKALIKGVKNGTIDAISSDHWPQDIESKKREFDYAAFGIINLQTAFSVAFTALKKEMTIDEIIPLFTTGPSGLLDLESAPIAKGQIANLTLFNPEDDFIFRKEMVLSKSKNSPFFNLPLKGKVYGICNRNKLFLND